ncbi:MAG: ABC transporter, partial [Myxococcaceae bacterium]
MNRLPSHPMSWMVGASLICVFVGERLLAPSSSIHWAISGFGLLLLAIAIVMRVLRASSVKDGRRYMESRLLALYLVIAAAELIALWLTNSVAVREHEKLSVALTALFPALILSALLPIIFGEVSYASTARAETVERGRLRDAMFSGLGLSFLIIFAFSAYYVASERDSKVDLSFFRAAKPGSATVQVVRGLEEPVTVTTFFPPANEVGETVQDYLSTLQKESPNFKVEKSDVALQPAKAKELGVSGNGVVLLQKGGRKEQLLLGTDFENARSDLAKFDGDFQRRLLAVSRNKRNVYLVSGHGERSEDRGQNGNVRTTIRTFKDLVEGQNLTVKHVTSVEGLANEVASDAAAVMVIGPTKSLLPEEA